MKWGIDQWSRYVEFNGDRYSVDGIPWWKWTWRVSKFTGLGWAGHEAERDVNE